MIEFLSASALCAIVLAGRRPLMLRLFPELSIRSHTRQFDLLEEVVRRAVPMWLRETIGYLSVIMAFGAWWQIGTLLDWRTAWFGGPIVGLGTYIHDFGVWGFGHRRIVRELRRKLNDEGMHLCIRCGYDVSRSSERCPECGAVLEN